MSNCHFALRAIQKIGIDRLLTLSNPDDPLDGDTDFIVEPMINGREKGFLILKNNDPKKDLDSCKAIIFSEHRNTDQLRVVWGIADNFDIWAGGNSFLKQDKEHAKLSDQIFETQEKTFEDFDEAVAFIEEFLGLKEVIAN